MTNALRIVDDLDERLPAPDEVRSAQALLDILAPFAEAGAPARLSVSHASVEESFDLSPAVARTLVEVLRHFSSGKAVTLVPVGATLTTQQAADMLNVSRPHLIKLLESGKISFDKVGSHRRIPAAQLFAYKKRRDEERDTALLAMSALDAENDEI